MMLIVVILPMFTALLLPLLSFRSRKAMWIYLETEHGGMRRKLSAGEKPEAEFLISADDKPVAAYEYCNLHGLWKKEL